MAMHEDEIIDNKKIKIDLAFMRSWEQKAYLDAADNLLIK